MDQQLAVLQLTRQMALRSLSMCKAIESEKERERTTSAWASLSNMRQLSTSTRSVASRRLSQTQRKAEHRALLTFFTNA